MITTEQKVQVAKDRALDELMELFDSAHGYWNLTKVVKNEIREVCRLVSLPDNSQETLKALDSYVNGEEDLFFQKDK